jgi:Copper type II ascorbate-dependent monooxygenase, C-terminal domain.
MRGLLYLACCCSALALAQPVTFTHDIAPILYANCISCHRSGEVAPFPLVTYADAAKRASLIAKVTASRYMPPWKPDPGYGEFAGARGLTAAQIAAIRGWADGGAPEGKPSDLPAPPQPTSARLAHPDLIARMPQPFSIPADGPDLYRCFVIPLGLDAERYVDAVEFRPGNPKVVHHALFFVDRSQAGRKLESAPAAGYPCFGAPGFLPGAGLGGWSPGSPPIHMPEGAATVLTKQSDLVIQLHFHPTGKAETEQGAVALSFTSQPPRRHLIDIPLGSQHIDIAPGDKAYKVSDHFTLPVDVEAIAIIPHAHYICKEMRGVAHLPDGSTKWLLKISDWDFNWQEHYRYVRPVHLPADTRLEMEFLYDNSDANPHNPSHPPRRVRWGPDSTDEMAGLHLNVLASRESDFAELAQALWGKFMRSVGGGFFTLPEKH